MRRWRAHVPGADPAAREWVLDRDESHHLSRVLRLQAGDGIAVFDGAGREWEAEIVVPSATAAIVRPGPEIDAPVEPGLEVTLYQGRCRADRFDWIVQKGTEIGVGRFVAVRTARSEPGRDDAKRSRRWERIALEAAKQSGRRRIPGIETLARLPGAPAQEVGIVLDAGEAAPLGAVLSRPAPRSVAILVGPESGLAPEELDALSANGWQRAGLGPRVLRTETAGPIAAALILHAWADLGRAR